MHCGSPLGCTQVFAYIYFTFLTIIIIFIILLFRDNVAGRNADFANILQRVNFAHAPMSDVEQTELGEIAKLIEVEETAHYGSEVNSVGQRIFRILDHDLIFFFGDFNVFF